MKSDFESTIVQKDKEGQYIIKKGSTQQRVLTKLNIYKPKTVTRFIKLILLDIR